MANTSTLERRVAGFGVRGAGCGVRGAEIASLLLVAAFAGVLPSQEPRAHFEVTVDKGAGAHVQQAATELASTLSRLTGEPVEVISADAPAPAGRTRIQVGPVGVPPRLPGRQQEALARLVPDPRPETLLGLASGYLGGGSEVAAAEAVHRWCEQNGVRHLPSGDLFPLEPTAPVLSDFAITPHWSVRAFRTLADSPIGPSAWGLDEHRRVVRQLAKLGFNELIIKVHASQPFLPRAANAAAGTSPLAMWRGRTFDLTGDVAGRGVFRGADRFAPAELADAANEPDLVDAGVALVRALIAEAHEHGLRVALECCPFEGGSADASPEKNLAAARERLLSYLKTYPGIDVVQIACADDASAPPPWLVPTAAQLERLWREQQSPSLPTWEALSTDMQWNDESLRGLGAQIATLRAVRGLLADRSALRFAADPSRTPNPDSRTPALRVSGAFSAKLQPWLDSLLPKQVGVVVDLGDSLPVVAEQAAKWGQAGPAAGGVAPLVRVPLASERLGVLPQVDHLALRAAATRLAQVDVGGVVVDAWNLGDCELDLHHLGEVGLVGADAMSFDQVVAPVLGPAVAASVSKAFQQLERAHRLLDEHDDDVGRLHPEMLLRAWRAGAAPPEWWAEVRECHLQAMNEMYRANTAARESSRTLTLYYARRCEFGFEYFNCVEALRRAGAARAAGDQELAAEELAKGIESLYGALNALAAVARSGSDQGVIAVLNEYGYRPLNAELEKLEAN